MKPSLDEKHGGSQLIPKCSPGPRTGGNTMEPATEGLTGPLGGWEVLRGKGLPT